MPSLTSPSTIVTVDGSEAAAYLGHKPRGHRHLPDRRTLRFRPNGRPKEASCNG